MVQNESIERFKDLGYVLLKDVIPAQHLRKLAGELHRLVNHPFGSANTISNDIMALEAKSHQSVYNASISVGSSLAAYNLINASQLESYAAMTTFGTDEGLHVTPLHVSIQIPRKTNFDYAWHIESDFYPWAPKILNCWFPILAATEKEVTGTIGLIPKSHLKQNRKHTKTNENNYVQIVSHVTHAEEADGIQIEAEPGDMLLFHADMVHKTCPNLSNVPRVTGIIRVIDQKAMKESRPLYKALAYVS